MADKIQPLHGKRVVVTRAAGQSAELIQLLEREGAEVLLFPAVSFQPPADWSPLDTAIGALASFDWLLLTSQNAVQYLCQRCAQLGVDVRSLAGASPKVAAVGPATSRVAESAGLRVSRVAATFRGEALASELAAELRGKKVLLPRSDRAGAELPAALKAAGADVVDVVAYQTVRADAGDPRVLEQIRHGEADVVTFASPSAFHAFVEQVGDAVLRSPANRTMIAVIGPVTARAVRDAGFAVAMEAESATSAGLVQAIAAYFAQHAPSGVTPL